jgi:GNAT superfamily N-acetyltransferase
MGLREPVGPSDVEAIETFFLERGALPVVNACPLAEHSMFSVLGGRGWTVAAFENVLFRELEPDMTFSATEPGIEIRRAETPAERATWAEMVANGFVAPALPSEAEWQLAHIMSARPSGTYLLAYVDDRPVGTGELHVDGGVGWLSADTTMPDFRGRGIQSALQRERLRIAVEAGCDVAVTESIPGSVSQRNMERLGFRVAYTRTDIVLVRPPV